jgi:hypothetical protein
VPSLSDETVTIAYLRSVTDEDAEAQLRHPALWAYAVRDPTGAICIDGHGKTRRECEVRAGAHAAGWAEEAWPQSRMWLANKWRFLIWLPLSIVTRRGGRITPRIGVKRKSMKRPLSPPQLEVLRVAADHKLYRFMGGWHADEPGHMYSLATINSLWERGLLDANVIDPRVNCRDLLGVRKLDGAPKSQVWASGLGRSVLKDRGLLIDGCPVLYH